MIPAIINYIWQGSSNIPKTYLENVNTCYKLNTYYQINVWHDRDCDDLIHKYNFSEIYKSLHGIQRYNFIKYLIMHDTGGVYSDFDIKWKQSFDFLMQLPNRYYGEYWPLNVKHQPVSDMYFPCYINSDVIIADDPFFIVSPGKMLECIEFCMNRDVSSYKIDIELFYKTGNRKIHTSEPYGPYGLTEWLQQHDKQFNLFFSQEVIEQNSVYAEHLNGQSWR
jgi:hypothetical protein